MFRQIAGCMHNNKQNLELRQHSPDGTASSSQLFWPIHLGFNPECNGMIPESFSVCSQRFMAVHTQTHILTVTVRLQTSGPLYSNTVVGTLAVQCCWVGCYIWSVSQLVSQYILVEQGADWVCCGPAQSAPRSTKCNSPLNNGQCTNFILFNVSL